MQYSEDMNNGSVEYHFLLSWRQRSELMAMTDQGRMQLLQEILQAGAEENNWRAIVELLATWPETPAKEIALEYGNQQMGSWPDHLRVVNAAWRHLYRGSQLSPVAKIVKELRRLIIRKSSVYPDGMRSLVTTPWLASLSFLALELLTLTDEEFDIFCSASMFHSLTWLRLRNIGLNTKLVTRLIQSPVLKKVSRLELPGNHLDDNSMSILVTSDKCVNLRSLNLSGNFIRDEGGRILAEAKNLYNLEELDVSHNNLSSQAIAILRQSTILKNARIIV
jgi:Ran GTPase-activating protein (RanGAP) involved in mRNA processing and transport